MGSVSDWLQQRAARCQLAAMGVTVVFFIVYSVFLFLTFDEAESKTFALYLWIIYLLLLATALNEAIMMIMKASIMRLISNFVLLSTGNLLTIVRCTINLDEVSWIFSLQGLHQNYIKSLQIAAIATSVILQIWLVVLLKPLYLNIYRRIYYAVGAKMDAWVLNKKYNLMKVLLLLDLLFTIYLMITVFFYLVNHVSTAWIVLDAVFVALSVAFFFLGNDAIYRNTEWYFKLYAIMKLVLDQYKIVMIIAILIQDNKTFGNLNSAIIPKYRAALFGIPAYLVLYAIVILGWNIMKDFNTDVYQRVVQQKEYALLK